MRVGGRCGADNCDCLDFDEEFGAAEDGLDSGGCGEWIKAQAGEEGGALFVKCRIVALDIAQVTGGADDIVPGGTLGGEEGSDIGEGAAELSAEVSDVDGYTGFIDAGGA